MNRWIRTAGLLLAVLLIGTSLAQAAREKETFRIVLVPERNIFEQQRKYRKLCDYTCTLLPLDITFDVLKGYEEVLLALKEGKANGAFMGSFVAAYGIDNYGFVPLVRPVWPSGESHYSSYIFKRSDLPLTRDIANWKGRSFVFSGPHTSAGYYFPLSLLRSNGVAEPGEFFSSVQFAGSHDAALWMVANDMADLGAAKSTIYLEFTKRNPELGEKVEVLYSGGRYPDATLVVLPSIPREVRESLRSVFLTMDTNPEGRETLRMFGALKFINTQPGDFDGVRQVVEGSGMKIDQIRLLD
ncbi:MAG: phosphate/phosphite/phosphonate ABC transporter substrate-binding protein [bacterium]|nr:MAG: phosphate/phosphite/phosphonate ABC transporter substrate-binding protein [bacterium]